ncbi:alpha/beta fold hydrolase [Sediminibacterium goheungense]|uniref:Pimeloyl-ACP methyl ester carboxylesterase n=1 Tax=Sediminibacterium goheungense TaxID=1086393 RepID=A0A4R6J527_9BACT|nr:alpha/beta hydrolase [Sediminibacterium goheungense]TDO29335.1 pimeloyl-ACP methyl ester carboxylesterase [Sediminibacterium goheungense]
MQDILLLHGAIGSEDQFSALRSLFSSQDYRIHSFNFSGHGGKPINKPLSMELFASETFAYIREHSLNNVSVFGYSMGGYVAIYLSTLYPDLIGKIATLGTKYHWSPEIAAKEIKMLRPDVIEEKIPAFAAALAKRHGAEQWKLLLKATADMLVKLGNNPLLHDEVFSKINTEILLLIGEKDNMVSLAETQSIQAQLHNSSMIVLADTLHPLEQVNASYLAETLLSFFSGSAM